MRRRHWRIFSAALFAAGALSLIFCLTSLRYEQGVGVSTGAARACGIIISNGTIHFVSVAERIGKRVVFLNRPASNSRMDDINGHLGFKFRARYGDFVIGLPLWLTGPLLIAAGIWIRRRLCNFPKGMCRRCGYDLRATPDRCPECG